jgi:hypothetical protein
MVGKELVVEHEHVLAVFVAAVQRFVLPQPL